MLKLNWSDAAIHFIWLRTSKSLLMARMIWQLAKDAVCLKACFMVDGLQDPLCKWCYSPEPIWLSRLRIWRKRSGYMYHCIAYRRITPLISQSQGAKWESYQQWIHQGIWQKCHPRDNEHFTDDDNLNVPFHWLHWISPSPHCLRPTI